MKFKSKLLFFSSLPYTVSKWRRKGISLNIYFLAYSRQSEYRVMMGKAASTKQQNCETHGLRTGFSLLIFTINHYIVNIFFPSASYHAGKPLNLV